MSLISLVRKAMPSGYVVSAGYSDEDDVHYIEVKSPKAESLRIKRIGFRGQVPTTRVASAFIDRFRRHFGT